MTKMSPFAEAGWASKVEILCATFWNGKDANFSTISLAPCN